MSIAVALQESQSAAQDSGAPTASTAESQRVLAELRASNPSLTKEQERAAMQRLLNQGTHSVRPLPVYYLTIYTAILLVASCFACPLPVARLDMQM